MSAVFNKTVAVCIIEIVYKVRKVSKHSLFSVVCETIPEICTYVEITQIFGKINVGSHGRWYNSPLYTAVTLLLTCIQCVQPCAGISCFRLLEFKSKLRKHTMM